MNPSPHAGPSGLLWLALIASATAHAADTGQHVRADGFDVHYGFVSAALVKGDAAEHGGRPTASGATHLVVTVFDGANGRRVEQASITARVGELGLAGEEKTLELMRINDTVTFGNYFRMPGAGPYRINLRIMVPGARKPVLVQFDHRRR